MRRNEWRNRLWWSLKKGPEGLRAFYEKWAYRLFSPEDRLRIRQVGPDGWARTHRALRLEFYQREGKRVPDRNYKDPAVLAARYLWLPRFCR